MYYWTPKRIKELKAAGYKLHASPASLVKKSDQAISDSVDPASGVDSVRPGSGLKLRHGGLTPEASGDKPQAPSTKHQAASTKPQAPSSLSNKLQASSPVAKASSFKPQASSAKIPEPGNK